MKSLIAILFFVVLGINVKAQEIPDYKCEDDYRRYASLCVTFENKSTLDEDDPSGLYYKYEKILADYAQADLSKDNEDIFIKKINAYVQKCSKNIVCDPAISNKKQIDLLKLAVATIDWEFLDKAVNIYKFPLNDIGINDNMTILDFIYEDIEYYTKNNPSSSTLAELKKFYGIYKNAGAKHHKIKL